MLHAARTLWRVAAEAPNEALADAFVEALSEDAEALTAFESEPGGVWLVQGFLLEKPDRTGLETRLALAAMGHGAEEPVLIVETVPDVDWLKLNQESFPPLVVGRFFVHGSHVTGPPPAGATRLRIDAATAFGTGEHATTRGCLLALDRLARRGRRRHILDMGTGTGILAMAAAKLWHEKVVAADIDRNSVHVASENAQVNGVGNLMTLMQTNGYRSREIARRKPYDLVFANILARPLASMAPALARHLAPGGVAILSGLLASQENYVAAAHRGVGLVFQGRITSNGWHTLIWGKPPARGGIDR